MTSGAILIKKEKINSLAGNQIREIHAGLISKLNVDSLAVWVSESLDGSVLSTDTISTPAKGWNTVALTKPVDITSDMQTLYVGYSYHQKSTSKAMSCTKTPEPGYSCFIRSGNDEWKDYSNDYTVSVEAMVYGDKLPKYDLTLSALDVQQNYVVDNGNLEFTMKVFNNATVTINGFDAVCTVDGSDDKYTVHCDSSIAYNESKTITMTVSPTAIQTMDPATRTLTVTLTNLTEGEDEIPSDNTLSGTFNVTIHSFVRNVLLEEYTTEKCTNCPRVASYVHDAMNEPEFQGRLNTMENHAGYYTDSFTATFHNDWTWLFDNLYAPAVLYDRHAEDGEATAVTCPNSKLELFEGIRKRLRETAFVSLKVTADVDGENQKINVKVTGTRAKENFTKNPARITVVLTETNLAAISQAGAGGDYTHYNVGRRVNRIWGDVLEWNGDDYTYECSIPYTQNYVLDNLGILAFIHDYDPDDKTKCDVANSAAITSAEFTGKATAIFAPNASTNDSKALYFDLQGRKLSAPTKGFNIVKRNGRFVKQILH